MAFPKNALFPLYDQEVSISGRILGHPARLYILQLLEAEESMHVKELVNTLPLSEGTVTEHLKKLRKAGLINVEVAGLMNRYSLNREGIQAVYQLQKSFFDRILYGKGETSNVEGDYSYRREMGT